MMRNISMIYLKRDILQNKITCLSLLLIWQTTKTKRAGTGQGSISACSSAFSLISVLAKLNVQVKLLGHTSTRRLPPPKKASEQKHLSKNVWAKALEQKRLTKKRLTKKALLKDALLKTLYPKRLFRDAWALHYIENWQKKPLNVTWKLPICISCKFCSVGLLYAHIFTIFWIISMILLLIHKFPDMP